MRTRIALLAVAASGGPCGRDPYDPCAGKACGEACRTCAPGDGGCLEPALPPAFATVCDPQGRCAAVDVMAAGGSGPAAAACPTAHPDCAGKACGEPCDPCGPDATCPTLIASACDRFGGCSGDVPWLCHDPCSGKACGEGCTACPPPPEGEGCVETAEVKACDAAGRCTSQTPELVCP